MMQLLYFALTGIRKPGFHFTLSPSNPVMRISTHYLKEPFGGAWVVTCPTLDPSSGLELKPHVGFCVRHGSYFKINK